MDQEDSTAPDEGVETEADAETEDIAEEVEAEDDSDVETGQEDTEEDVSEDDENEEDEEPEEIEFDFGGNKLRVPKDSMPEEVATKVDEFAKGLWASYTQKSQDVAEQVKSVEARASAVDKLNGLQGAALESYALGMQLQRDIAELQKIDMADMWQKEPDRARQFSDLLNQKQAQLNQVAGEVSKHEREFQEAQTAEVARRSQEGKQVVERYIPGFADKAPEVIEYAMNTYGISREAADQWSLDPISAVLAYKAMQFDRMQEQAKKPKKPKPKKPVKPMRGKGGKGPVDPDKLPPDQWLKWRNQQIQKKAAS